MRTINKISCSLLLAATLAGTLSCKKSFLQLDPPTSLNPQQALATEADLAVALKGAYSGLRAIDLFGRTAPVLGDLMADNAYQHSLNTNRYTLFNNYTFINNDLNATGLWTTAYNSILRVNNIINSPLASTVNIDQYKGEAMAIRALSYFYLVQYFARPYTDNPAGLGVPIITKYDPDYYPSRNTVQEVYTLINADLDAAFALITKFTNSSQFSKYAVKALQAKVYLAMGDKTKAKTAALDVINNSGFTSLTTANHAAYWASGAIRTDKLETLFEVSSDAVNNNSTESLSYLYAPASSYGDLVVSDELFALFGASDVRLALYPVVNRPKPSGPTVPAVNKYPAITGDLSDTKVVRMSEMYLIAAEASLPSNEADAITYVNFVTSRRGANAISSTGSQLLEDVLTERRKELAFEGTRYLDLMRLKRDVKRSTNYPAAARTIVYSDFRRILPIPLSEINANVNIKSQQNTGY